MNETITHQDTFTVVGLPLRTSNDKAFETIPPHWAAFSSSDVASMLGGGASPEVYAVYGEFEHEGVDNDGDYTLVIGHAVPAGSPVPDGLHAIVVPESARIGIPVEQGRVDLVGPAWQRIWARDDIRSTYIADYERYTTDGDIEISIGVAETP